MKRKIGKVGLSSLIVTLPNAFVRRNKLTKGDEIDIIDKGNSLVLSSSEKSQINTEEVTINISGFDSTLIWRYVLGAYNNGHQTIKIVYDSEKIEAKGRLKNKNFIELDSLVKEICSALIGMEVISKNNNQILLKEVASKNDNEFFNTIRRIIYLLKQMVSDVKNGKELLQEQDSTINRLCSYCTRILSMNEKYRHKGYMLLIHELEKLGDGIKELENHDKKLGDLIKANLDIINASYTFIENKSSKEFYLNCDKLKESGLNDPALTAIRETFREIGQILIENKLKLSLD
jgi:phosphate uptake regulator